MFGVRIEHKLEEDRYYYPNLLIPYFAEVAINWIITHGNCSDPLHRLLLMKCDTNYDHDDNGDDGHSGLCKEGIFRSVGKANVISKLRDSFSSCLLIFSSFPILFS